MFRTLRYIAAAIVVLYAGAVISLGGESTSGGWEKSPASPVLGGDLGVCFDVTMLEEDGLFKMWFSWRSTRSIAYTESADGIHWSQPVIVIGPGSDSPDDWNYNINRPGILKRDGVYHLWYTSQSEERSVICYATSADGIGWEPAGEGPVLTSEEEWEKTSSMCPHVLWDEEKQEYKMWYSAGEQLEPNAIGLATSPDGIHWTKDARNPVFQSDPAIVWEQHKVTAAQVIPKDGWYYFFYIGFENENLARIGIARSRDGATGWERLECNPIISPTADAWDGDACYKPFAIYDKEEDLWRLWYNGRKADVEQIGLVTHRGEDLDPPGGRFGLSGKRPVEVPFHR